MDEENEFIRSVGTVAELRNMPPPGLPEQANQLIYVRDYYQSGGEGGGLFCFRSTFPYNARATYGNATGERPDDGGRVIIPSAGGAGKWVRMDDGPINVKWFGAIGDGIHDDTVAMRRAVDDAYDRGGAEVYLPPTGKAYRITDTISLGNGVALVGAQTKNFPGENAPESQWTASGSWIKIADESKNAVELLGHGSGIRGINFIHAQGAQWNPAIQNNWTIVVRASQFSLSDIVVLNTAHGIIIEYTTASGGGAYSYLRNIYLSCYKVGLWLNRINDNIDINAIHFRNLVSASDVRVVQHLLSNYIGMAVGYLDNPHVSGLNFFQCHTAMVLFNDSVVYPGQPIQAHSLYNGQFSNVQFNLCRFAMRVESSQVVATGTFSNVLCQGVAREFGVSISDTLFSLRSDFIDFQFENLRCPNTGGSLMEIGSGTPNPLQPPFIPGATIVLVNIRVNDYATLGASDWACFVVTPTVRLRIGTQEIGSSVSRQLIRIG